MDNRKAFIQRFPTYPHFWSKKYHCPSAKSGNYYSSSFDNYRSSLGTLYVHNNFNHNRICQPSMRGTADIMTSPLLNSESRISRIGAGNNSYSPFAVEWNKPIERDMTTWKTSAYNDNFCQRISPFRENQSQGIVRPAGLFHHESPAHVMFGRASDLSQNSVNNSRSLGQSPYITQSILPYSFSHLSPSLNESRTRFSDEASPLSLSFMALNEDRPRYLGNQPTPWLKSCPISSSSPDQMFKSKSSSSLTLPSADSFRNIDSFSTYPIDSRPTRSLPTTPPWRCRTGDANMNRSNYTPELPRFSTKATNDMISQFELDDRYKVAVSKSISLDLYYEMKSKYLNSNKDALCNTMNSGTGNINGSDSEKNVGHQTTRISSSGTCFNRCMSSFFSSEMRRLQKIDSAIKKCTDPQYRHIQDSLDR